MFLNILITVIYFVRPSSANVSPEKRIIGKLVDKVESKFDCGVIKVGVVNKFVIVKDNKDTKDTVKVVCICSEGSGREFFKVGKLYDLSIVDNLDLLKGCYVLDNHPSEKLKVWVLREIKNHSS